MTYIGEVTFNSRTLKQRFLTPKNAKSSSSSVGARVVKSGWVGLYGRPWGRERVSSCHPSLRSGSPAPVRGCHPERRCTSLTCVNYTCHPERSEGSPAPVRGCHPERRCTSLTCVNYTCHPERSEGSIALGTEILRFTQDDKIVPCVLPGAGGLPSVSATNTSQTTPEYAATAPGATWGDRRVKGRGFDLQSARTAPRDPYISEQQRVVRIVRYCNANRFRCG